MMIVNDAYGIIYKATRLSDEKAYIGQTTKTLDERRAEHQRCKLIYPFHRALRKHEFRWEILQKCSSRIELDEQENSCIEKYKTIYPNGFNLKSGGYGGGAQNEISKRKISKKLKGRVSPMKGRVPTETHRKRLSESHKGKQRSLQHSNKISESLLGRHLSNDHKLTLSQTLSGRRLSEQHKQNLRKPKAKKLCSPKPNPQQCGCGCGEYTNMRLVHRKWIVSRFKRGHMFRLPEFHWTGGFKRDEG